MRAGSSVPAAAQISQAVKLSSRADTMSKEHSENPGPCVKTHQMMESLLDCFFLPNELGAAFVS